MSKSKQQKMYVSDSNKIIEYVDNPKPKTLSKILESMKPALDVLADS